MSMVKPPVSLYLPVSRDDQAWGLYVTGVGYADTEKGRPYPATPHPAGYQFDWERGRKLEHFALVSVTRGSGVFESTRQPEISIGPGDVLVLFPGEWHRYRPQPDTGWEEYWVAFNGKIAREWVRRGLLSPERPIFHMESKLSLVPDFEVLITLAKERDPLLGPLLGSHCYVIVAHAVVAQRTDEVDLHLRRTLRDIAHYLMTHIGSVDMQNLALRYGLSYTTFRRAFLNQFGVSPGRFRQEARTSQAKRLLTETALPLKVIAEQLSYGDPFYFMQSFKRNTGFTPNQWRRGARKQ